MKESIFITTLSILIVFQGFYYFVYPTTAWSLGITVITSFISTALVVGILGGVTAATVGINEESIKIAFILSAVINLLFQLNIDFWVGAYHAQIPVGIGLLYPNAWNLFVVDGQGFLGFMGFIFMTLLVVVMLICGMMIAGE